MSSSSLNTSRSCFVVAILVALVISCDYPGESNGQTPKLPAVKTNADIEVIPERVLAVCSFRFAELWRHPIGTGLQKEVKDLNDMIVKEFGVAPSEIDRLTLLFFDFHSPNSVYSVTTISPFDRAKLLTRMAPSSTIKKIEGKSVHFNQQGRSVCILDKQRYLVGSFEDLNIYLTALGKSKQGLPAKVKKQANNSQVFLGINVAGLQKELKPLPFFLEPYGVLFESNYAAVTGDLRATPAGQLTIYFDTEKKAAGGVKALELAFQNSRGIVNAVTDQLSRTPKGQTNVIQLLKKINAAYEGVKVKQAGNALSAKVVLDVKPKTVVSSVSEAIAKTRQAAERAASAQKMKQIGIAMHNYHDTVKSFPPRAVIDKNGKALHSWRVLLLPYLGEQQLYNQFKLNEPWDSPHNKKLLTRMPAVFDLNNDNPKNTKTHYQVIAGKDTVFEGMRQCRISDILDGTSNTIMFVEAAKPVPWTKPEDVEYMHGKPLPKLGGIYEGGFHAAICDGSVRFIQDSIPLQTLDLLLRRNDGMVVPDF